MCAEEEEKYFETLNEIFILFIIQDKFLDSFLSNAVVKFNHNSSCVFIQAYTTLEHPENTKSFRRLEDSFYRK